MKKLERGDKCQFYIDDTSTKGTVIYLGDDKVDVLTWMGIVENIPISEVKYLE